MEFIAENYIWFIIGGVVILMTIIGYIADKTNFTKKEENREKIKKSKKKKVEKIEELPEEEPVVRTPEVNLIEDFDMDFAEPAFETDEPEMTKDQELVNNAENNEITNFGEEDTNDVETSETIDFNENPVELKELDENFDFEEVPVEKEEITENDDSNGNPVETEEVNEIFNFDETPVETNENVDSNESPVETEEDLYVGLDGTPNAYKETENSNETTENLEIELPSLSSLDNELKEETDEDDVWKF